MRELVNSVEKTSIGKLGSFYCAYAPEFDLCPFGDCRDEELNNLAQAIAAKEEAPPHTTGDERKRDAII